MNPFKAIGKFFVQIGTLIRKAFQAAQAAGLTDDVVALVLPKVRELMNSTLDNATRREQAVSFLRERGVPEAIARLAVELAVRLVKAELAKVRMAA
jgi:hypothetical protein